MYTIKHLNFTYAGYKSPALNDVSVTIKRGEFITLCGSSGCGKTTLLKQLKPSMIPHGIKTGEVFFNGTPLEKLPVRDAAALIGFVQQSPENQIVTDKVWHELAFGLENLGYKTTEIRLRVAEMASFFGIQHWFHKPVTELSGGQKQLLNLAAVMAMQPGVLILDEPTSQLDPIATGEFLAAVSKLNRELGLTVILTEHRLEEAFVLSDRIILMEAGRIIADGLPQAVGLQLRAHQHAFFHALPAAMRVWSACSNENESNVPITVRDGARWLHACKDKAIHPFIRPSSCNKAAAPPLLTEICEIRFEETNRKMRSIFLAHNKAAAPLLLTEICEIRFEETNRKMRSIFLAHKKNGTAIEWNDVWFTYTKTEPDVIKGLSFKANYGEITAILGGNGTGKTTALSLAVKLLKPYRGNILINGKDISKIPALFNGLIGILLQNPKALFVKKTVREDLSEMIPSDVSTDEEAYVNQIATLCRLHGLLDRHPNDLSDGEQQRAALAKVLMLRPSILMLDEPTKGLDAAFKQELAAILKSYAAMGAAVVMVSHDVEFCAEHADYCALFFDGAVVSQNETRKFFTGNTFYTTAANRMARDILPEAVTVHDIVTALGGRIEKPVENPIENQPSRADFFERLNEESATDGVEAADGIEATDWVDLKRSHYTGVKNKISNRTIASVIIILLTIPLTLYAGVYLFGERYYYFISLLIIFQAMVAFALVFESRKPSAQELVILAVLCAIAVAGRAAFFMLPQVKPVIAIVIIAGLAFGAESGFLVGVMTGFVSNFFFGQGPWTPWQMFAFGIIGFLAGMVFKKGWLPRNRIAISLFGGIAALVLYGGIINPASVLMFQPEPTWEMFLLAYVYGLPFDLVHAVATMFFLLVISQPMLEKLERVKVKYGLF